MAEQDFQLRPQQQWMMKQLQDFCAGTARVFILSGYAGTGKTTLLREFARWLESQSYTNAATLGKALRHAMSKLFVPLASTGRAAQVLTDKIGQNAATVHSWIYYFNGFNQDIAEMAHSIESNRGVDSTGQLLLDFTFEPLEDYDAQTIYIIDEASMISDTEDPAPAQAKFGSGKLLSDLISFDPHGKFVFVGDECQLPPVNGQGSPALSAAYISSHFHVKVMGGRLTDITRQDSGNDIIMAAARMRKLCANPPGVRWGKFPLRGYSHIGLVGSQLELVSRYVDEVDSHGYNYTTLITGTNKNCNMLSRLIRKQLGFTSQRLMVGELLLVTQNNLATRLMNGDMVRVKSIGNRMERAHLTFVDVEVEEVASGCCYRSLLIEDIVYSNATNLSQVEQKSLFFDFFHRERSKGISQKDERFNQDLMRDPFLNALRCVYGYAITCHKSQGGEWPKVYLDIPRFFSHEPKRETYQWLYTAMTRASETLYVADGFFIA